MVAAKDLAGTYIRNIEPNRKKEENELDSSSAISKQKKSRIKTLEGISKYFYWQWSITGPLAGYILARPLPSFGQTAQYSPALIANLSNTEILHPSPTFSEHTQSDTKWLMPIPVSKFQDKTIQNEDIEMEGKFITCFDLKLYYNNKIFYLNIIKLQLENQIPNNQQIEGKYRIFFFECHQFF